MSGRAKGFCAVFCQSSMKPSIWHAVVYPFVTGPVIWCSQTFCQVSLLAVMLLPAEPWELEKFATEVFVRIICGLHRCWQCCSSQQLKFRNFNFIHHCIYILHKGDLRWLLKKKKRFWIKSGNGFQSASLSLVALQVELAWLSGWSFFFWC